MRKHINDGMLLPVGNEIKQQQRKEAGAYESREHLNEFVYIALFSNRYCKEMKSGISSPVDCETRLRKLSKEVIRRRGAPQFAGQRSTRCITEQEHEKCKSGFPCIGQVC